MDRAVCPGNNKVPNFIELLRRKYCLVNFFAKQDIRRTPVAKMKPYGVLAGNQFLYSKIFLCLASLYAYMLHAIVLRA